MKPRRKPKIKYASIILVHYSLVDDYGGKKAYDNQPTRSEMLKMTISSIVENTKYPAELIVMDNGGKPDDSDYLLNLLRKGKINAYVRYKNNMQYAFANNQGAKLATGDYLCFTCNDVMVKPNWLTECVRLLEQNKDRRLVATPLFVSHIHPKYNVEKIGTDRINPYAGSNCLVMDRRTFRDLGDFHVYSDYGNQWFREKAIKGYMSIAPPENLAVHLANHRGLNWHQKVKIVKTLLDGKEINFDESLDHKDRDRIYEYDCMNNNERFKLHQNL